VLEYKRRWQIYRYCAVLEEAEDREISAN
jgi:hypothetical protein